MITSFSDELSESENEDTFTKKSEINEENIVIKERSPTPVPVNICTPVSYYKF